MFKKRLSQVVSLTVVITFFEGTLAFAQDQSREAERRRSEQVKSEIAKLGTGPDARIKVNLLDRSKVEGYVSEAGPDSFVVLNPKTRVATTVAYPQVATAKGNNLSDGAKIAIAVAVTVGLSILYYKYGRRRRRVIF